MIRFKMSDEDKVMSIENNTFESMEISETVQTSKQGHQCSARVKMGIISISLYFAIFLRILRLERLSKFSVLYYFCS